MKIPVKIASDSSGDWSDIVIAACVSFVIFLSLTYILFTFSGQEEFKWLLMSGCLGVSVGWTIGMVITPYEKDEAAQFKDLSKLVYGFVSGYLFSKIDPVITSLMSGTNNHSALLYIMFAACWLLPTLILTYVSRKYWAFKGV